MWFSLTEDKKTIIDIGREGKLFRVKLIQREDTSEPTGEILWMDLQRRGFWESAAAYSKVLKAVGKHCPHISQKKFEDVTKEVMNAANFEFSGKIKQSFEGISDKAITDAIMGRHSFYCDKNNPNLPLYVWNGCRWHNGISEGIVLEELSKIFQDEEMRNRMLLDKTVEFIKGTSMDRRLTEKQPNSIVFNNGVLNIDTMEMAPHDENVFAVNVIPHDYDPNTECPNWTRWIGEVVQKEDLDFLQEWMGYQLYTAVPEAAFLILIGTGQNGKTIFMNLLATMVGDENITNISLADLSYNDFMPAQLYQKLSDISDDIGRTTIKVAGRLKEASSGSRMTVNRKFGQPFDICPYAKITYACNEAPEIRDESDALKFRIKVVEFPYTFTKNPSEGERLALDRREIEAELVAEIPGIIRWAIEGLKRLVGNNFRFSVSKSTEEMWAFYRRKSRPVACFVEECLTFTDEDTDWIPKEEMFKAFKEWVKERGLKTKINRDKFFRDMKREDIEATRSREHDMKRVYLGTKFVPTFQHSLQPHVAVENENRERENKNSIRVVANVGTLEQYADKRLSSVTFTEDYPGDLVSSVKPMPKGAMIVLPSTVAQELKRKFGFVELKPLEAPK